MFTAYILRGIKAGVAAGLAFGLFVAFVGNPLIGYAEAFESGGHGGGPVVADAVTATVSILGGVLLAMLFGALTFGVVYYFFEPAIPGGETTKSYLLAAGGFLTISGAPWLALPPQPPGVEQTLSTDVRISWYVAMMVTAVVASSLVVVAYNRLRPTGHRWVATLVGMLPLGLVFVVAAIAPANPVSGPIPGGLALTFRAVTVIGQFGLWFVLASAHVWLLKRERTDESGDGRTDGDRLGSAASD